VVILVADDVPRIVEIVTTGLRKHGYQVVAASDGREALQQLRSRLIDLVISDLLLPGMDGLELLTAIRRDPQLWHTPLLLMVPKCTHLSVQDGFDGILIKPFTEADLMEAVDSILRSRH
jgi:CheY-like chemotaxis protein